ncbi:hypothetical protein LCI18_003699 [Fusarium solani-melongenae]|uniref:Uncharacterized protein n=1 Tax=Fusarium solani subsp. cucurbitae TaxID=2747967 RepID=A0ACD3YUU6_FUSSC|nr:hypothetical protein LCI18_003699 [Fusarium solani-melongenae]
MKVFPLLLTVITFLLCTGAVPCTPKKKPGKCPNLVRNASFGGKGNKPWRYVDKGASPLKSHILKEWGKTGYTSLVFDITRTNQRPQAYQSVLGVRPDKNYNVRYSYKVMNGAPKQGDECKLKVQVGQDFREDAIEGAFIKGNWTEVGFKFKATNIEPTIQLSARCEKSTENGVQIAVDDIILREVTTDCPA